MAAAREYELVLMLDPGGDEVARDALAQEAKARIEAGGTLKHESDWGLRKMAYEIAQRNEADYRWFRFEGPTELLDGLNHSLRIADGVLRFRIFKVDAETPTIAPPASGAVGSGASRERPAAGALQDDGEAEAPQPAAEAEPTAEPAPEAGTGASERASEPVEPAAEVQEPAPEAAEAAAEEAPEQAAEPAPEATPVGAEDPGAEGGEATESSE